MASFKQVATKTDMSHSVLWFLVTFVSVLSIDIIFDCGKWALGRYTEIVPGLSIAIIVGFSACLALMVELIHRKRRSVEKHYEQYLHHKARVWVEGGQRGKHWQASLCPQCTFFLPDTPDNCLIESVVHTTSRQNKAVLVIWECPKFRQKHAKTSS